MCCIHICTEKDREDEDVEETVLRKQLKDEELQAKGNLFHQLANNFADASKHQIQTFK